MRRSLSKNTIGNRAAFSWGLVFPISVSLMACGLLGQETETTSDSRHLAEASTGQSLYRFYCGSCHGLSMGGGEGGPALKGRFFQEKWPEERREELRMLAQSTMPLGSPDALSKEQHSKIFDYFVEQNEADGRARPEERREGDEGHSDLIGYSSQIKPLPEAVGKEYVEWPYHRANLGSANYSSLSVINPSNVGNLEIAWRWKTADFGAIPEFNYQCTPLMVNGVVYATAGTSRAVVALDATTGETLWIYRYNEGIRGENAPRMNSGRGVSYWRGGKDETGRILLVTPGFRLVALAADTGRPVKTFGDRGVVDLKAGVSPRIDLSTTPIGNTSPPLIVDGVVIVGPAFPGGAAPPSPVMAPGYLSGYDVVTGKRKWVFNLIPHSGEKGYESWEDGSAEYTGNVGAWAPLSADGERGLVYVPVEAATGDYYGGHRPGDNLYSQSLLCIDAKTGKRVWHFQLIHHGIWDYDTPAPPVLADVVIDGKPTPIVAQVTKQAFLYVFNRVTGEPVWPIEEREVPASTTPGEKTSPTQPHPTWPLPFDRQGTSEEVLVDFTDEIRKEALRIASEYTMGPLFTPASRAIPGLTKGSLILPESIGGGNWQGGVLDPESNTLYIPSVTILRGTELYSDPNVSSVRYVRRVVDDFSGDKLGGPFGLPLVKPPWGRITAIDLNTGEQVWMVANADTPEWVRDHPKLKGVELPRTGKADRGGLLVTKSLLFSGEGSGLFGSHRGGGNVFRAIDKRTGETVHEIKLPARQSGIPMTYAINGKQYIVVAVGGPGHPGELVALGMSDQ